jgi:signal transduction histidine kinase
VAASDPVPHELREREKELAALHGFAAYLRDDSLPPERVLGKVIALLPAALQFPEDAAARVTYGDRVQATPGWRETPWCLRAAFGTNDGMRGTLEVAYLREFPAAAEGPFLAEERRLLDSLARLVADGIDRRKTEERFRLFVGTGRIRLFEWNVPKDHYTWPGIPGKDAVREEGALGLTREEVDRAIHPDDLPGLRSRMDAALADPERDDILDEYRAALVPGNYSWRQLTARIVRGPDGRAERVLGISVDISEKKALETRLRETQKMEALGRLAGGVAHDFNNLLAVMIAGAELASSHVPESNPARRHLLQIENAGFTAAALVKQILAFGRRQELRPRKVDLRTVVEEMDGMLSSLLEKRVRLRREFAPDAPAAMVDPVQFQQVVLNLCVNARDAMPRGGTLTLRVRGETAGAPREDGTRDAPRKWATFEVEDTGTGMPPELLHRIFEPFFTTKAEGKGTGLGLATVHGIVKQSEGFLEVESEVGRGTLFRVRFPVAP